MLDILSFSNVWVLYINKIKQIAPDYDRTRHNRTISDNQNGLVHIHMLYVPVFVCFVFFKNHCLSFNSFFLILIQFLVFKTEKTPKPYYRHLLA